ncbi:MAG TPA: DUF5362 family protein [Candidatus Bipolaricaulota bacterium]
MDALKEARKWIALLGWLNVFGGVLSVLLGLLEQFQLMAIIAGALGLVAGFFLLKAAKALGENEDHDAGENLRKYFTFQGILALIALIGTALALLAIMAVS